MCYKPSRGAGFLCSLVVRASFGSSFPQHHRAQHRPGIRHIVFMFTFSATVRPAPFVVLLTTALEHIGGRLAGLQSMYPLSQGFTSCTSCTPTDWALQIHRGCIHGIWELQKCRASKLIGVGAALQTGPPSVRVHNDLPGGNLGESRGAARQRNTRGGWL